MNNRFFTFLAFFLSLWVVLSFFQGSKKPQDAQEKVDVEISTKKSWVTGQLVTFQIKNNLPESLNLGESKNPPENLIFQKWFNGHWENLQIENSEKASQPTVLAGGETREFSFSRQNNALFGSPGDFRIVVKVGEREFFREFAVERPGVFRSLWRTVFFKPIFNILIFFVKIFPNHSLGLAILALTVLMKLLLLGQSKNALVQQQKMQKVQKEIDKMRKRFAGDQQKIAQETMALWKKHKVNPFASIVPIFVQFPIMIALFFVVRDGLLPHNQIFLFQPLADFNLENVSSSFMGFFNLSAKNVWPLAILIAALQAVSMKLSFSAKKATTSKGKGKKEQSAGNDQMQSFNKIMMLAMPVMIGFFTLQMPAAVGFYWGVSTVFSIGQQLVLQRARQS